MRGSGPIPAKRNAASRRRMRQDIPGGEPDAGGIEDAGTYGCAVVPPYPASSILRLATGERGAVGGAVGSGVPGGLVVGGAADPEEVRADRVADSVMRVLRRDPDGTAGPVGGATSDDAPATAWRRSAAPDAAAVVGPKGGALDQDVSRAIASRIGGGSPIPASLRRSMEGAFGRDLGGVRLHTDERAALLSRQVSARAFTVGRDVFFGAGEYQPDTADGQHVLAHELAHTVHGGGAAHRIFESKKTDQEKLASEQKKAAKRQNKQAVKDSKAAVSTEHGRLKEEREKGRQSRAKTSADIAGDRETTKQTVVFGDENGITQWQTFTGVERQSGAKKADFDKRFKDHLDREAAERQLMIDSALMSEDQAAEYAYDKVWMKSSDPEVRAARPPRETAAERLVSDVKKFRTAAGVRESMLAGAQRGTLLPKAMEELYEKFVVIYDKELKATKSEAKAEAAAAAVWTEKNLKGLPERPKVGSSLDKQAREDARRRVSVLGPPKADARGATGPADSAVVAQAGTSAASKPEDTRGKGAKALDALSAVGEKIQSGYETVAPVLNTVGAIASAVGLNESVDMRNADSAAAGFAGDSYQEYKSGNTAEGNQATELLASVGGADVQQIMQTDKQYELGVRQVDFGAVSTSTTTLVGQGFGAVTSMLGDIIAGANGAIVFVKSVQKAHSTGDPHDIAAAAKVGADALASFNASAKSAATFATVLDPGVTTAVAHVVPGLDIAAAALGIISGTMSMVGTGMRVQSTQLALNSAHLAMSGGKPNVLIYPLLRVEQSYVKTLEQNTWTTVKAVSDLGASIAQLASAGGFGVPAAYKAATNLLTLLHSVGHMIADDVLARMAKKSQQHSIAALEGSAEERLQRDPAMAVDGIIVSAIKGDDIATLFLSNFTVGTERIDAAMLGTLKPDAEDPGNEALFLKIRSVLLGSMGNDVDPMYTYEKFAKSAGGIVSSVKKHTTDKFARTGELAEGRNKQDEQAGGEGDRGLGWRMKMMFTREHQLDRKLNGLAAQQRFGPAGQLDPGMWCRCGTEQLPKNPSSAEKKRFEDVVRAASDEVLRKSAADPANPADWQQLFFDELQARALRVADVKAKNKVSVG